MNRWPRRFLAMLACLGAPLLAVGQDSSSSHLDELNEPVPRDIKGIARLLDARRGKVRDHVDEDLLRRLMRNMPRNLDVKALNRSAIDQILRDNPELRDPKFRERLHDLIQQQMNEGPNPNNPTNKLLHLDNALKKLDDLHQSGKLEWPDPKKNPLKLPIEPPLTQSLPPQPAPPAPTPSANEKQVDEFSRWLLKNVGDSPATRDMMKDFAKIMGEEGLGDGANSFLQNFGSEWKSLLGSPDDHSAGSKISELLADIKPPDLGPVGTGGAGLRPRESSPEGGAGHSESESPGGNSSWTGLLLGALLALMGFFYWNRFVRPSLAKTADEAGKYLAWPVDPLAVASREDVVKAFEFLSLSRCGQESVNWHHRRIADRLCAKEPGRRAAADQLAGLYEKARYAPTLDLFSEAEIAEARARLCQFSGAGTP